jgi:hypothetical protein
MSTLRDIQAEARAEWSRLQACWEETRGQWQDDVADEFERRRWRVWEEQIPAFLDALEKGDHQSRPQRDLTFICREKPGTASPKGAHRTAERYKIEDLIGSKIA